MNTLKMLSYVDLRDQLEKEGALPAGSIDDIRKRLRGVPAVVELMLADGARPSAGLLFLLPPLTELQLVAVAASRPTCYNEDNPDVGSRTTFLSWRTLGVEVRLDCWTLRQFPDFSGSQTLQFAFVSGSRAVVSSHSLTTDEMEAMEADIQSACASSGPNCGPGYRPYYRNLQSSLGHENSSFGIVWDARTL